MEQINIKRAEIIQDNENKDKEPEVKAINKTNNDFDPAAMLELMQQMREEITNLKIDLA